MRTLTALIVFFCLAGVVVSGMALGEHYNTQSSPCRIDAVWDCGIVNQSPFAELHSVPVAMIGIVGYALLGSLAGRFPWIVVGGALFGMIFALRLTWIEWKLLQVWCIYCVSSQGIIIVVLVLALAQAFLSMKRNAARA